MTKVYMFNDETLYGDLKDNNIKEENIEEAARNIIEELRKYKVIEINGNYIVGSITGHILYQNYKVNVYEELLI